MSRCAARCSMQIDAQAEQLCAGLRRLDALETELELCDVIVDERDEQSI